MKHISGPNSRSTLTNVARGDVQPNAVDLRLGKVLQIRPKTFILSEDEKVHRGSAEIQPDDDGWFTLGIGSYEVVMENIIKVGEGEAGWVIPRSTLNRNGVFLTSGLYDSGYHGVMAATMHVTSGPMRIKRGTRIGQYISFESESLHMYDGSYGLGKAHDVKYDTLVPEVILNSNEVTDAPKNEVFQIKRGPGRPKKSESQGLFTPDEPRA